MLHIIVDIHSPCNRPLWLFVKYSPISESRTSFVLYHGFNYFAIHLVVIVDGMQLFASDILFIFVPRIHYLRNIFQSLTKTSTLATIANNMGLKRIVQYSQKVKSKNGSLVASFLFVLAISPTYMADLTVQRFIYALYAIQKSLLVLSPCISICWVT